MSGSIKLSNEQREAIESQQSRYTVRASAGSGKTTVLVQRFLTKVLEEGLRPDEVLAITFTRKAAAEMKFRVVERLKEAGKLEEAQIAETGPIQTIHSFCESLLREHALAAGLDPRFEIIEGSPQDRIFESSFKKALQMVEEDPWIDRLIASHADQRQFGMPHGLMNKLQSDVRNLLDKLRSASLREGQLEEIYRNPKSAEGYFQRQMLEDLKLPYDAESLPDPEFNARLVSINRQQRLGHRWIKKYNYSESAVEDTVGLARLTLSTWRQYEAELAEQSLFDFSALESKAVDLVRREPGVAEHLRQKFKVLLVDEAQDVNPKQYELLDALGCGSEMLVGDPQQSIYGFREADFELFVSRSRSLPCLRLSRNYRSKESLQRYVDALFGSLWGEDFQPSAPPAARDEEADPFAEAPGKFSGVEYWPADRFDTESVAERISQLIEEGHAPGEIALLFRKGKTMSAYQDALARRNIESQIEGGSARFYTRLEVRDVANMLRAVTDPTDRFALLALLRSPFVDLSLNTMVKAARHEDALELLQDYGQLEEADREKAEDFLEWFLPLREYGDRLPAWELMSEALAASNFWPNLARRPNARQAIANVRKLLSLATENPELGGQPFAEQVRDIQSVKHKEGEAPLFDERANAVTLTTIHKAKGLEFPVVVLPDTYGLLEGNLQADVFADRKLGIVATKFGLRASLYYAWLKEKQRVKNHQEELRVLYVALTRAVSRLCIVTVRSGQNEKNIAGLLPKRVPADERNGILVREPQAQEVNSD